MNDIFKLTICVIMEADGERYTFVAIRNDGSIQQSAVYEVNFGKDEHQRRPKTIFDFIITVLDSVSNSIPHTVPASETKIGDPDHSVKTPVWVLHSDGLMYLK